ncbi:MAG TPA: hypothetical protein VIP46_00465 [Pyrinomonadaceae bacterium]
MSFKQHGGRALARDLAFAALLVCGVCAPLALAQEEKAAEKAEIEKARQQQTPSPSPNPSPSPSPSPDAARGQQQRPADPMSAPTFMGLRLRLIGPAFTSGRIGDIAVHPTDPSHYYVAVASGGVWKTTNNGATWTPVFDREGSYSIGTVVLDPKNPLTVWVGTGENNSQRSVSYGDGVYRSDDGGKTWRNLGLKASEHISKIVIDPRDSNTVYVAAQGPLWGPGGDRGLYKTTDNGKTWKRILEISENTGVTDVVQDPNNPDTLYASAYQRRRHVWTLINGGPESAIHKSTDGGATWTRLRAGLPTVDMGRIGLAISPVDSNVIYATVEAADRRGGIYRSSDRGGSWERRNDYDTTAMYYGEIFADPKDVDRIYLPNVFMMVSDDGGRTLRRLGERSKHVDNHVIWINPANTNHYFVGSDGGLYESYDRGATWIFKQNLPVTQFYDVAVDNQAPFYNVYGGTQDNFSVGGPSRTRSASGITNADWFVTQGGDGFRTQVDPTDPNIVYAESQYGGLVRFDRRTGERMGIQPQVGRGEEPVRWNWDTPFIISPHKHTRLYFAANKLFKSEDRGDSWTVVSGELSRLIDRDKLPVMGRVWGPDAVAKHASTSFFGNATALAESPKKEGLLYVGTDDGLIHVTEDGGRNWRKLDAFPGVPDQTYVSRILASVHDANTVYATFENHLNADFKPYALKSADAGRTWTSIKGDLPANGGVWAIAEDHVNPNLLFVGTEYGLYFSIDGGGKWVQLRGNFPVIAVRDIVPQRRENDLVVGTFGRGIYILDNYTPLRALKPETLRQEAALWPVKDAMMYIVSQPLGGRGKGFQGEAFYTADNPPFGATLTYYLKDGLKTQRAIRQESERAAERSRTQLPYPTGDQLRAEEEEEAPAVILTISDSSGRVVRRLQGPTAQGIHRVNWDLRYPAPTLSSGPPPDAGDDFFFDPPAGALVMPGEYRVTVSKRVGGVMTQLAQPQSFTVYVEGQERMNVSDRQALVSFQQKVGRLQRAVAGAMESATTLKARLGLIRRALLETPNAGDQLLDEWARLDKRANALLIQLRGDVVLRGRNYNTPPSISERVGQIVGDQRMSTARPTQTQMSQYEVAARDFEQALATLRALVEVDLKRLEKAMEEAGAPHTPGRIPEWRDQ